jgi:S-formylglutathione hydrolase FrmB
VALFGLMQVWSGYFIQTKTGVFAHASPAALGYNSPLDYVHTMRAALARYPLHAFMYVGSRDRDRDRDQSQTEPMALALQAEGADVQYAIYSGRHSWDPWTLHADQMLAMASGFFALAARS